MHLAGRLNLPSASFSFINHHPLTIMTFSGTLKFILLFLSASLRFDVDLISKLLLEPQRVDLSFFS